MDNTKHNISIVYGKNCFDASELEAFQIECADRGLVVFTKEYSPYLNASIDFFYPFVKVALSPENIAALYQGIMTSGCYDAIKFALSYFYKKFHRHPIYKIQGHEVKEETANIQFSIGNNLLVLPVDVDEEKFQYVVDRFFEVSASTMPDERTYTFLSEDKSSLLRKTEQEIIQEECSKHIDRINN